MRKFLILLICLISVTGCKSKDNIIKNPSDFIYNDKYQNEITPESIYIKHYKNKDDTYTMFLFSSPIAFEKDNKIIEIDNSIVKSDNPNFSFMNKCNDIRIYFPNNIHNEIYLYDKNIKLKISLYDNLLKFSSPQIVNFKNIYGTKVEALKYSNNNMDIYLYPTIFGIRIQLELKSSALNQISFNINSNLNVNIEKNKFYILGYDSFVNNSFYYIIQNPLVFTKNSIDYNYKTEFFKNNNNNNILRFSFNNTDRKIIDFSIDLYKKKMLDCSIYSALNYNCFLSNISMLGESNYGTGVHMLKNNISDYINLPNNIIDFKYCFRKLYSTNDDDNIDVFKNNDDWASSTITWNQSTITSAYIRQITSYNNYYQIDLNKLIKNNINFDYGFSLKKKSAISIIGTNDNNMYCPYYIIKYKKE